MIDPYVTDAIRTKKQIFTSRACKGRCNLKYRSDINITQNNILNIFGTRKS